MVIDYLSSGVEYQFQVVAVAELGGDIYVRGPRAKRVCISHYSSYYHSTLLVDN